jgi:glycosyltransferase involved in cell wall biosynthesis
VRIGIDASSIVGDRGGVGWHTYHLLKAMIELNEDVELVGYVNPGSLRNGVPQGWDGGQGFKWVEAGRLMMRWRGRLDELDLYHGTNFKMRTTGRFGGVVTIYDLWMERHPEYSPKLFGQRASSFRTRRTAWRARKVITISEFSAREIESLYGVPPDRIVVIPCGVSGDFRPRRDPAEFSELRRRMGLPDAPFILFVGGADPRKNHQAAVRAFAKVADELKKHRLVLVGDPAHRFGDMGLTIARCGVEGRVLCPGRMPIEDIVRLYSHADLFVFPSLYEGFGMPVIEAMACGVPVVTSNRASLPEVAGNAALLVNPDDDDALAGAMVRALRDTPLRESLRAKGFERARQFTWERAARQTLEVYREVCGRGER